MHNRELIDRGIRGIASNTWAAMFLQVPASKCRPARRLLHAYPPTARHPCSTAPRRKRFRHLCQIPGFCSLPSALAEMQQLGGAGQVWLIAAAPVCNCVVPPASFLPPDPKAYQKISLEGGLLPPFRTISSWNVAVQTPSTAFSPPISMGPVCIQLPKLYRTHGDVGAIYSSGKYGTRLESKRRRKYYPESITRRLQEVKLFNDDCSPCDMCCVGRHLCSLCDSCQLSQSQPPLQSLPSVFP
jgi:hypothetical protein